MPLGFPPIKKIWEEKEKLGEYVLVRFFSHCVRISDRKNFRKEGFISAHSFKGFSPW
jgi:hypothetical protein